MEAYGLKVVLSGINFLDGCCDIPDGGEGGSFCKACTASMHQNYHALFKIDMNLSYVS